MFIAYMFLAFSYTFLKRPSFAENVLRGTPLSLL